jgi:hypothetical protein
VESKIHTGSRAFKLMSSVFISILKINHLTAQYFLTWVDWGVHPMPVDVLDIEC